MILKYVTCSVVFSVFELSLYLLHFMLHENIHHRYRIEKRKFDFEVSFRRDLRRATLFKI